MKCPKCDYLGFETGDRCKNCGYDFSLSAPVASAREPELLLRDPQSAARDADQWLNQLEARLDLVRPVVSPASGGGADPLASMSFDGTVVPASAIEPAILTSAPAAAHPKPPSVTAAIVQPATHRGAPPLPLFHGNADPDAPLITLPAAPRPPLAVRRTPDKPRLRTMPKVVRKADKESASDPVLAFAEEPISGRAVRAEARRVVPATAAPATLEVSGAMRRVTAAVVDHLILLSIDAAVVYLTFQIAGLSFESWQALPLVPLALFLAMLKLSYFSVFTMLGGQTVGKMATGIRVVGADDRDVEPARAIQRTLAAIGSLATVGIGFAPVLLGGDRRALHDRVAGTRVVGPLPSLRE